MRLLSTMVAGPSSVLESVEASYAGRGRGETWAKRLTCTMQRQGRPQFAAAAYGYRYLREGAMGEPGRPGPTVERCPHDPHRGGQGRGSGRPRGQARARGACSHHARAASDENRIFIDSRRPISVVRFSDQRQHAYASNLATATGDTLMILLTSAREQPRLYC
jgi:hypothetical protein